LVFYALVWALENASLHLLTETPCAEEDIHRYKVAVNAIAAAVMASPGEARSDLPACISAPPIQPA